MVKRGSCTKCGGDVFWERDIENVYCCKFCGNMVRMLYLSSGGTLTTNWIEEYN